MKYHDALVAELRETRDALLKELLRQWLANHVEHCRKGPDPLHHDGWCAWPLPAVVPLRVPDSTVRMMVGAIKAEDAVPR